MKKHIILAVVVGLALSPTLSFASIDTPLSYGSKGPEVTELQEFLIDGGYLTGEATGNFYSLTLKAVKKYQSDKSIPNTGYVGALTRASINAELTLNLKESTGAALDEDGTSTSSTDTSEAYKQTQAQAALLTEQINAKLATQKEPALIIHVNSINTFGNSYGDVSNVCGLTFTSGYPKYIHGQEIVKGYVSDQYGNVASNTSISLKSYATQVPYYTISGDSSSATDGTFNFSVPIGATFIIVATNQQGTLMTSVTDSSCTK